jgi:hypothetical protein
MAVKWLFDCGRINVVAAPYDQVLPATGKPEVTVGIAMAKVTCVEPSLAIAQVDPKFVVLFITQVAVENVRTGNDQQAHFIGGAVTHVSAGVVRDNRFHRLARDAQSDRTDSAIAVWWIGRAHARSLCQTLALKDPGSSSLLKGAEDFDWHRRSATQAIFQ